MSKRVAVIDIGSNSLRMLIYERTSRFAFRILHEAKSRVRLSENAYKNSGNLQEVPMQRAYEALLDFSFIISSFKVRKTLCVATSALRDAPNKSLFITKIRDSLGINIKVIDGQKEAYYGSMACMNLLPELRNALTIDIGGGSTEFSCIDAKEVTQSISLELGTVRLKELFFDNNDISGAKKYIDSKLELLEVKNVSTLVGIGGTFRAISSAIMQKSGYPIQKLHAYQPEYDDFYKLLNKILEATDTELIKLGIKSDRFDVIKPGALILLRVLEKLKVKKLVTSGVGVREGVFLSDLLRNSKDRFPLNFNTSIRVMIDLYIENKIHSNQLNRVVKQLFDLTYKSLGISKNYRDELSIAAKIYNIGSNIHFYSQHKHSYELIQDLLEFGFSHKQITLVSTLVRYAKRKTPPAEHMDVFKNFLPNEKELTALSYLLWLSVTLLGHRPRNIDFSLDFKDNKLFVESKNPMYLAKQNIKKLETIKNSLQICFVERD